MKKHHTDGPEGLQRPLLHDALYRAASVPRHLGHVVRSLEFVAGIQETKPALTEASDVEERALVSPTSEPKSSAWELATSDFANTAADSATAISANIAAQGWAYAPGSLAQVQKAQRAAARTVSDELQTRFMPSLFTLPPEMRSAIYREYLEGQRCVSDPLSVRKPGGRVPILLFTSRQFFREVLPLVVEMRLRTLVRAVNGSATTTGQDGNGGVQVQILTQQQPRPSPEVRRLKAVVDQLLDGVEQVTGSVMLRSTIREEGNSEGR